MTSLHNVIETWKKEGVYSVKGTIDETEKYSAHNFIKKGLCAICFDMGDLQDVRGLYQFKVIGNFIKLPYPVCWFEHEIDPPDKSGLCRYGTLCWETEGSRSIVYTIFRKWPSEPWVFCGQSDLIVCYNPDQNSWKYLMNKTQKWDDLYGDTYINTIHLFLSALKCNNVKQIENFPPEKLQKKRIKNGKQPLFSYWTLHLAVPNESKNKNGDGSGSHASPRLHLRRGHPREYKPGQWTWVQPCVVGDKTKGIIHKDYKVKPKEE